MTATPPSHFVEVAIPLPVHQTFTYRVPAGMTEAAQSAGTGAGIQRGCRVVVPFGKRMLTGYVVEVMDSIEETGQSAEELKEVEELLEVVPLISEEMIGLTKWVADYYYAPWGEVLKATLPAGINVDTEWIVSATEEGRQTEKPAPAGGAGSQRARPMRGKVLEAILAQGEVRVADLARTFGKGPVSTALRALEEAGLVRMERRRQRPTVQTRRQQAVRLLDRTEEAEVGKPLGESHQRLLETLRVPPAVAGVLPLSEALSLAEVSPSIVRTLEKRGYVEIFSQVVRRDPLAHLAQGERGPGLESSEGPLVLTEAQTEALRAISEAIDGEAYRAFLLHGVTGSGKTEVYLRAMQWALQKGRSALLLVPEISLTPMVARRLRSHFGDLVAILHSSLSEGERLDEWERLRRGEARICIGARSAVFAPLQNLGLIIIDEEHETSYKQDESPRYHGRDSAIMRASRLGAVVVLGSATPSMESFHNAQTGKYGYLSLAERIGSRAMARVETIDMRTVFARHGRQQIFADELKEAIRETAARGEQSIVLLNRRGYSSFLLCRSCGHTSQCRNCAVTLTYHRQQARLVCHYCNHAERVPQVCPDCQGGFLHYVGEGTEQIEAQLRVLYPELRIGRLDRDTTRRRGAFEKILGEFAAGEIDLLVGTQMIAKGHDFPNVTLVGVISVDAGLGMPDFRAAERTFQLVTQVAGRAGRGEKAGRVLLQSYFPDHYALQYGADQDYNRFYQHEIRYREEMRYPPFAILINILIRHEELARAAATASELASRIKAADRERVLRILGPAAAPLARLKGEHRLQILIKTRHRRAAREALDAALTGLREAGGDPRLITIDMDPISLM
jgi:primosomal protein N' (replication factor Y)